MEQDDREKCEGEIEMRISQQRVHGVALGQERRQPDISPKCSFLGLSLQLPRLGSAERHKRTAPFSFLCGDRQNFPLFFNAALYPALEIALIISKAPPRNL
jgi:hypothetical protein